MADDKINDDVEIWKPVRGYESLYSVSSSGRIRSFDRVVRTGTRAGYRKIPGRILNASNNQGYRRVSLYNGSGGVAWMGVHVLVCEAFHGSRPQGLQVSHLNGTRNDNRACNLKWSTPKENNSHKDAHGTSNKGERHSMAILTEKDVRAIRSRVSTGENNAAIAADYGVSRHCVYRIKNKKSWWWLE